MVARSRCAEDILAAAVAGGADQYVVLGAGLDTFAYRNPFDDLRVFEVDHPATQAWKRACLAEARIAEPGGSSAVTFVPVDFEHQALEEQLQAAGFSADRPAIFAWLGVTMYLAEVSVWNVLRYVLSRPAGSAVIFDYALAASKLSSLQRVAVAGMAQRVARAGEPWTAFFDPDELARGMRDLGARRLLDLDGAAINARYFAGRRDALDVGSIGHLIVAGT